MSVKTKGVICGVIAAVSYGTNPLGALSLYEEGYHVNTVLFYRYGLAALILLFMLLARKESLRISKGELKVVALLGLLFASSSLTLFTSFHYMDAGIASTLLFVYPIMVALLMAIFFKEKISIITWLSISLALTGITLLYDGGGNSNLSSIGVVLVLISSLTYAIYIIVVNKAERKFPKNEYIDSIIIRLRLPNAATACAIIPCEFCSFRNLYRTNRHIQYLQKSNAKR